MPSTDPLSPTGGNPGGIGAPRRSGQQIVGAPNVDVSPEHQKMIDDLAASLAPAPPPDLTDKLIKETAEAERRKQLAALGRASMFLGNGPWDAPPGAPKKLGGG